MDAQVKSIGGVPRPCIGEELFNGVMAYTYPEHLPEFVAAGIEVFRLSLPVGWVGEGRYDYAEVDETVAAFCKATPRARLFPLLWLDGAGTKWWEREHPSERALARSRSTGAVVFDHPSLPRYATDAVEDQTGLDNFDKHHQQSPCLHSFASEVWRRDACAALRQLIEHLDRHFPDRFIGYYVCGGLSYEWFNWGNYTDDVLFDYSEPMERYFRRWLEARYGTVERLARAWHRPVRSFLEIQPPAPAERPARDAFPLLDPVRHTPAADFAAAQSDAQADAFLALCRVARQASPSPRLVGGFWGYWWTQTDMPGPARNGHLALQRVLESPDVDFLASPYDYTNRGVGGVNSSQTLPGSIQRHGKLYINSTDIKLADDSYGWQSFIRVPRTPGEAVALMQRDFAASLASGQEQSWVDLFGGAFKHPALKQALGELQRLSSQHKELRVAPQAECLVVVDEESLRWTTPNNAAIVPLFGVQKQWHLLRAGMPWVQITLADFLAYDWPDAKLVYFVNLFRCEAATRERLHAILRERGCAAVWTLWPGVVSDSGLDLAGVADLTGFDAAWMKPASGEWSFVTTPAAGGWPAGVRYGTGVRRDEYEARMKYYPPPGRLAGLPRLSVEVGRGDELLGQWEEAGQPALVWSGRTGFTSVFNASPILPDRLMQGLVCRAGGHAYVPAGDLVYTNDRFMALYTGPEPRRTVRFRRPVKVRDLVSGSELAPRAVTSLELSSAPETAHLWLCGY